MPTDKEPHRACFATARKAQCERLNKTFYESWPAKFFTINIQIALLAIAEPNALSRTFKKGVRVGKLRFKWTSNEEDQDWQNLQRWAKIEIGTVYFHALETLLRLFLAHAGAPACPWLEMANLTSFDEFKQDVKSISEGIYPDFREQVAYVMHGFPKYPGRDQLPDISEEKWDASVENACEHLNFFATDLLKNDDHNAFKHGLAVLLGDRSFQLGDGQLLTASGDSLLTLSHRERRELKDRYWAERISFFDVDLRAVLVYRAEQLIESIIDVGRARYLGDKGIIHFFDGLRISEIISKKESPIYSPILTIDLWPPVPRVKRKRKARPK